MSHSYYVICPTGAELVPVDQVLAMAAERWPGAYPVSPTGLDVARVRDLDARELWCDGSALGLQNASFESFWAVACWFRQVVPDGHELILTDTSSGAIVPFTESTTEEEVRAALDT